MKTLNCIFATLFLAAHVLAAEPVPAPDSRAGDDGAGIGKRKLEGYLRPDFAKAPLVAPLDRNIELHLAIGLPVRDRAAFDALVDSVSDPKDPNYRKFLTPEEVIARFGPAAADYDALAAFMRQHGFRVVRTFDNRYVLDVSAPVATVEQVLHVHMNQYRRPDGTLFFALDRDPSIDYDGPILFISGLENYVLPKRHLTPYQGSGPGNLLNSADVRKIYADSNAALLGQGESVGLLELITPIIADIYGNGTAGTGYAGRAGLPSSLANPSWPAGTSVAPLLMWPPGSTGSTLTSTTSSYDATSMEEAALDVEMAMAMAPALDSIVTYTASQIAATNFMGQVQNAALVDDALNAMISPPAGYPRPRQISASLSWLTDPTTQQIVKTMALQHQSFFTSSGDLGAYQDQAQGANCAARQWCYTVGPNTYCVNIGIKTATLVGGTLYSADPTATYNESEVAWSSVGNLPGWSGLSSYSSGGGVMDTPAPPYQAGFSTNGASTTHRNSPDVAAGAGMLFFVFNGGGFAGGGTSASAPLWAGYTALVNQQRAAQGLTPGIGFLNPTLYALASANYSANFHDVTVGANSLPANAMYNLQACSGFSAGTGYDLVTGLGSPTGTLITNLAGTTLTAANEGDPHLSTVDGVHYDFQSAGEFVSLRDAGSNGQGVEIQTRQTPVTTAAPYGNSYTGLTTCVSLNTAVAARVGSHRISYQPNLSGIPDPSGLQLRVDGALVTLPPDGIDLGGGARVIDSSVAAGAIEVDFPGGTQMVVTPRWWGPYDLWYLNVGVFHTQASEGIIGARAAGSWLPALPNGGALGPMPAALPQRFTDLYQTFADAWRVSDASSLFDYAPGTSTASFTLPAWPPQNGDCTLPDRKPVKPLPLSTAKRLCRGITGRNRNADCVFDTMAMGDAVFAKTYLASQRIEAGLSRVSLRASTERSRVGQEVRFVATVAPSAASREKGKPVPKGTVQFTVDGRRVGAPVKLGASGEALLRTSELAAGKHQVAGLYAPARGSVFLAGRSAGLAHAVEEKMSESE